MEKYFMVPLIFPNVLLKNAREVYREILLNWTKFLSYDPSLPPTTLSQYIWFNKHIKIGNNSVYFSDFLNHVFSFIGNLVDINGKYKSWDTIKYEDHLIDKKTSMTPTSSRNTKIMGKSVK